MEQFSDFILSEEDFTKDFVKNHNLLTLFQEANEALRAKVFKSARNFVISVLVMMKKKLPFKAPILTDLDVVFFTNFEREKWERIGKKFCNIITKSREMDFIDEMGSLRSDMRGL